MNTTYETPCLKDIVESYMQYRKVSGLKPLERSHRAYQLLHHASLRSQGMLTPGLLEWWWEKRATEQPQSHFARVYQVVPMLRYAQERWDIPPIPPLPEEGRWAEHIPHIFTHDELDSFFRACDTMHKPRRSKESILTELEVPVMFRLMYANGLRPNECRLLPRKCVDLRTGVIRIEQTKGYVEHRVVAKEDMLSLLVRYDTVVEGILPGRETFFPTSEDKPHRNDWLCYQFNSAWYKDNTARATAYDRHHYVIANIYSWREQGIGYGLTDRLLALSKSLGHANISSTLYYFSLVPAFEGEMADPLETALERQTVNLRLSHIREFLAYMEGRSAATYGHLYHEAARIKRTKVLHAEVKGISDTAVEAVLRAIDTFTDAGARDFVLTLFLNETGARLNETLSVRMRDIHADGKGKVTVTVTGKGGYVRTLYLTPVLTRKLKEYILRFHGESPNPEAYLFFSKIKGLNTKITARAVQKRMKELAAKAHEDCEEVPLDLHPHNYRHAYGTRRIKQGKQLAVVQREMGHKNIQSTMTYIDTSSMIEQAQEAAESEEVRKIKPIWTEGDSLVAMFRNRFMT